MISGNLKWKICYDDNNIISSWSIIKLIYDITASN